MIKIFSWNVNSINARLNNVLRLIKEYQPDFLLLQEIKCEEHKFPYETFDEINYNVALHGQKSYNGVAILSPHRFEETYIRTFHEFEEDARYIEITTTINNKLMRIASIYVPNGQTVSSRKFIQKINFLKNFNTYLSTISTEQNIFVLGGDFNVAVNDIDVYDASKFRNSLCFHDLEREQMHFILDQKLYDTFRYLHHDKKIYSWWDYRDIFAVQANRGWRIDYILTNNIQLLNTSGIVTSARSWIKPSDHAPIFCNLLI